MIHLRPHPSEDTAAPKPLTDLGWGIGHHLDSGHESHPLDLAMVDRLRNTGVSRYRVNVRWSQIILDNGEVDLGAVESLSDTIDLLLEGGIEPLVAMDNVAVPAFLDADGGWLNLATAHAYGNFAGVLGARLGDRVDEWITVASPSFAPRDPAMLEALSIGQVEALRILRAHCPLASIGSSIDIAQLDVDTAATQAEADHAWIDHLIHAPHSPDFVSVNISLPGSHTPTFVSEVIRMLATRCPRWSFVVTEIDSGDRADDAPTDAARSSERSVAVAALLDHVRLLRADHVDVHGTFTQQAAATAVASPAEFTVEAIAAAG